MHTHIHIYNYTGVLTKYLQSMPNLCHFFDIGTNIHQAIPKCKKCKLAARCYIIVCIVFIILC